LNFYFKFKLTLALASRVASASAAIARCISRGNRTSLTSTRSTLTPQCSVASSNTSFKLKNNNFLKINKPAFDVKYDHDQKAFHLKF
jgi:hypothetical protein